MNSPTVKQMACARIPTAVGEFKLCLYHNNFDEKEHLALIYGDVAEQAAVLVRIHSECFTGDVLGSLRCDCGPQLGRALELIAAEGAGIILYLRQEGRGIGLLDKLRAYNLQDDGYDTVEANFLLGHQADSRDYGVAALILQDLGVTVVRLLTNNPAKLEALESLGIAAARLPLETAVNGENAAYLATKVRRMRHLLNLDHLSPQPNNGQNGHRPQLKANGNGCSRRPRVTLSYAQSIDGSITARRGQPTAISGPESLTMTHRLRAEHDAILVGIGTVLADDPSLTVRRVRGSQPQPVIVDSRLRFPPAARLLRHPQPPWIFTTEAADKERQAKLEAAGARVVCLPANVTGRVSLPALLDRLGTMGIESLMVEGGARIITNFLVDRLVDHMVLTVAPLLLGGLNAVDDLAAQVDGRPFPRLDNPHYRWLGQDMVLYGDVTWDDAPVTLHA